MESRLAEFKVRNVGLAARCEVCHQDDLFNPETGGCARCQNVLATTERGHTRILPLPESASNQPVSIIGSWLTVMAASISMVLAIPGILVFFFILSIAPGSLLLMIAVPEAASAEAFAFLLFSLTLPILGCFLFYWYWKIALKPTSSQNRQRVWVSSVLLNGLLLAGAYFNQNTLKELESLNKPLTLAWFVFVISMSLISVIAFIEERFRNSPE